MARLLFEKTGNSVWISHLDLMRLFQRAFQRARLPLKHTKGFTPRPSVSIALPLSVGVESKCELLDFELDGVEIPCVEIQARLNAALVEGVRVLDVYEDGKKIKYLALLRCAVTLEYDKGIPEGAGEAVTELFARESLAVSKRSKSGQVADQDIIPLIRRMAVIPADDNTLTLCALVCCQNPSLNPMQLVSAIERHLPEYAPDFAKCRREEIYDAEEIIFR